MYKLAAVALLALCALLGPASSQTGNGALVVAVCGVLPLSYAVGSTRSITVDVNGRTC